MVRTKSLMSFFQRPIFQKEQTLFGAWMLSGLLYSIVKLCIGKYNNYKIFSAVFPHALQGLPLYGEYPEAYSDVNYYGPLFALVAAPFSMLPVWAGLPLWVTANTAFLFYAVRRLPLTQPQKTLVYGYTLCELMTAQGVQQFNIAVAACILLTFIWIEEEKEIWATAMITGGILMKIYPIVGFAFFFFSKHKVRFLLYTLCWTLLLLALPLLYTPGPDYLGEQYRSWIEQLQQKNELNMFAVSQNISLLGVVRKISGNASYSDLWLLIPGVVLFLLAYLRTSQFKYLRFRMMLLAHVLLFVVLFSTGSEASGYIILMTGIALWYINSPSPFIRYKKYLFYATLTIVAISTTELVPPLIRHTVIAPYAVKAMPCILVWLTVCYEMLCLDFGECPSLSMAE